MKYMFTDEDIQKLMDAQQEVFATKEDLLKLKDEIKEDFSRLAIGVDAYAHKADAFFQEMVMLSHQYNRHEKWIQMLAEKLGVKLEY